MLNWHNNTTHYWLTPEDMIMNNEYVSFDKQTKTAAEYWANAAPIVSESNDRRKIAYAALAQAVSNNAPASVLGYLRQQYNNG